MWKFQGRERPGWLPGPGWWAEMPAPQSGKTGTGISKRLSSEPPCIFRPWLLNKKTARTQSPAVFSSMTSYKLIIAQKFSINLPIFFLVIVFGCSDGGDSDSFVKHRNM